MTELCPKCGTGTPLENWNRSPSSWVECSDCAFHIGPDLDTWDEVSLLVKAAEARGAKSEQERIVTLAKPLLSAVTFCDDLNTLKPDRNPRARIANFILSSELREIAQAITNMIPPDKEEPARAIPKDQDHAETK